MNKMKYLSIVIMLLFVGANSISLFSSTVNGGREIMPIYDSVTPQDDDDEPTFFWEEPPVPDFLSNYADSTSWLIDTICVVNNKAYYYASDEYGKTAFIYSLDEPLCQDPSLRYDTLSTGSKTKFRVSTSYKSMIVDFSNSESIKSLKSFVPKHDNTVHFCKDYFSELGNMMSFRLEIDYPKELNSYANNVRRWLVSMINDEFYYDQENEDLKAAVTKMQGKWTYNGDIRDISAIGRFASGRFFLVNKLEYGNDKLNYPSQLVNTLSFRLVSTNGKYLSYQKCYYAYYGGAHGEYTQNVVSFDPKRNETIDWKYLFRQGCEDAILFLFLNVVKESSAFSWNENLKTIADVKPIFEDYKMGDKGDDDAQPFPTPGLTDTGVVFSFQPYEIGSFSEGCFHFTIPYQTLKPFLTQKAKELLNM